MTKNNLSNCLSWLLQHPHSFGNLDHISVVADIAIESSNEVLAEDEMARLQLAPQIYNKPRLHTQLNNQANPLPTPAPSRPSEEPKLPPSRPQPKPSTPAPSRHALKPRTPATSVDEFKFSDDILDIDEIDLTGDVTTSSFGEFGPTTTLWREDSATRIEPPQQKGKKRKSDEYESDLLSPRSNRKTTKYLQRITTAVSPLRQSQTEMREEHVKEEVSLTQTTIRPPRASFEPVDEFPAVGVADIEEIERHPTVRPNTSQQRPIPTPSQGFSTRRRANVVPDSDDDEADPAPCFSDVVWQRRY